MMLTRHEPGTLMTVILWDEQGPVEKLRTLDAPLACAALRDYAKRGGTVTVQADPLPLPPAVASLYAQLFGATPTPEAP